MRLPKNTSAMIVFSALVFARICLAQSTAEISTSSTVPVMRGTIPGGDSASIPAGAVFGAAPYGIARRGRVAIAFSKDGAKLAASHGELLIHIWNVTTGEHQAELRGHKDTVQMLAFSPDERFLASAAAGLDYQTLVWDIDTRRLVRRLNIEGIPFFLAFSPDSATLICGTIRHIYVWNMADGKLARKFRHPQYGDMQDFAMSPDGRYFAASLVHPPGPGEPGMGIQPVTGVVIWYLATGRELLRLPGYWNFMVFSADSKTLALRNYNGIHLLELPTGRTVRRFRRPGGALALSPDGKTLASGRPDGTIELRALETGQIIRELKGHRRHVTSLHFSDDAQLLASASGDCTAIVWQVPVPARTAHEPAKVRPTN